MIQDADLLPPETAEQELVLSCVPWAIKLARDYKAGPHFPADERIAVAMHGLCHAATRFDPDRGVKFSTYCTLPILRFLHRHNHKFKSQLSVAAAPVCEVPKVAPLITDGEQTHLFKYQAATAQAENLEVLDKLFSCVEGRDLEVIRMRAAGHTLVETGKRLGISKERVRQIQERAFNKIRERFDQNGQRKQP